MPIPRVENNKKIDPKAVYAANAYIEQANAMDDKSYWLVKIYVSTNLFLWHLDAFERDDDPVPLFINKMNAATKLLRLIQESKFGGNYFPLTTDIKQDENEFESHVSGLFSDIWLDMTDDIYFDQSYEFTKERFLKNGIDPNDFFNKKIVLDAGCGGGKFSTAIAKFGASKVIGLDIGKEGLEFAKMQAKKVDYGKKLEFKYGSLLDIPLSDHSVDIVWSNGVIHHTLDYEKCLHEFSRVIKRGGHLFLYVNGRFGLYELLCDTIRLSINDVPRQLQQFYLSTLGVNSGRLYWMLDSMNAPYEWKSKNKVIDLLKKYQFDDILQLKRGVASDQIEQISAGLPYAEIKYGEGQLKFIAIKQ